MKKILDEPEKMKGIICIEGFGEFGKYGWCIDLEDITIEGQKRFDTEAEARQNAMEWAKKLNVEVEG